MANLPAEFKVKTNVSNPDEYKDLSRFIRGREKFTSIASMIKASEQIVKGIKILHDSGLIFPGLCDNNILINPEDGSIIFDETDSICEAGQKSKYAGKVSYFAPEQIIDSAGVSIETDLYSLSVIIFFLWMKSHPLLGKNACPPLMDAKAERSIFGKNPVFIYDPSDDSNRPVPALHTGPIANWPQIPKYFQDIFIKAFSKEALNNPSKRIKEDEWLTVFNKLKDEKFDA